jgi:hypothetical protein
MKMIRFLRNRRDHRKFMRLLDLIKEATDEVTVTLLMDDLNVVSARLQGMMCRFFEDEDGINIEFQPVGTWDDSPERF